MVHPIIKYVFISLLFSVSLTSCYYDKEDSVYPYDNLCNTTNVTYSGTVEPILSQSCVGCHLSDSPSGNVILDSYEAVKVHADNGKLYGSINHDSGFSPMPKDGNKLSDCQISQIKAWIDKGSPNN
jgi:hypothetical protein